MLSRLKEWLGAAPKSETTHDETRLALERELQSLRLALQENEREATELKQALERQRQEAGGRTEEQLQTRLRPLIEETATPVAHLLTQAHLLEKEEKPVQVKDVLAVAKQLVRSLEALGLTIEEQVGDPVRFDPDRHDSMSQDEMLTPDEEAVVKLAGVSYQGQIIKKAGVVKRS